MPPRSRSILVSLMALVLIGAVLAFSAPRTESVASADSLRAAGPLKWYRGNLHTHSFWSDGDDFLESIALWYRDHNYDFLCFTDHNTLANNGRWIDIDKAKAGRLALQRLKEKFPEGWVEERVRDDRLEVRLKQFGEVVQKLAEPGKFLLIQGEEISDKFGTQPIHLNAHNIREVVAPRGGDSVHEVIQQNVDAVIAQRERTGQSMFIHLNHPNFGWGVAAEDLMRVRGENFFEVYNGHPGVHNAGDFLHTSTDRIWDIINAMRLGEFDLPMMYGLGTDDGHNYHQIPSRASEPGRGWVMVLADELTPEALIASMEAGRFYASSGVALEEITTTPTSLTVTIQPEPDTTYQIDFIGTNKDFSRESEPVRDKMGRKLPVTRNYSQDIGAVMKTASGTSASYDFTGNELYVRARITSSKKHPNPSMVGEFERAWTQPVRP